MRAVRLGDDQQARRVLVDAVHDAGALFAPDARQRIAAMRQQRVDQRAGRAARRGMDDHPGGLVDHDQVIILMRDDQRNGLGPRLDRLGRGQGDAVFLTLGDARLTSRAGPSGPLTAPSAISRARRDRDRAASSGTAMASALSSRSGGLAGMVTERIDMAQDDNDWKVAAKAVPELRFSEDAGDGADAGHGGGDDRGRGAAVGAAEPARAARTARCDHAASGCANPRGDLCHRSDRRADDGRPGAGL